MNVGVRSCFLHKPISSILFATGGAFWEEEYI